jgi:hypothetical protein
VLREAGLAAAEIDRLAQAGIVFDRERAAHG